MKYLRIDCTGNDGKGPVGSMTGIQITFDDTETDFHNAKAKALGILVQEFCRYGLHEALNAIGILDEHGKLQRRELDEFLARKAPSNDDGTQLEPTQLVT